MANTHHLIFKMYDEEPFWNPGFPSLQDALDFANMLMTGSPFYPPNPDIEWIYVEEIGLYGCWYGNDPPAQDWTAKIIFPGIIS